MHYPNDHTYRKMREMYGPPPKPAPASPDVERIQAGDLERELDALYETAKIAPFAENGQCLIRMGHTNWCALGVALVKRQQAKERA